VIDEDREEAVERLSRLLQQDLLTIPVFQTLVGRVLAATTEEEISALLAEQPEEPPLVITCDSEMLLYESPPFLAAFTELRCESGFLTVDLTDAELDATEIDLYIECDSGVMKVTFPRDVPIEVEVVHRTGGIFSNKLDKAPVVPNEPRIYVRVHNDNGVIALSHGRRRRR
jgi:hypothetical protein